ncbi:MAG: DUF6111 family protein [Hyphomonadaceae bacterium]
MTQRILVELLLFLVPFAVFLVYRAASRDLSIRDQWPLTRLVVVGAVIAILGLIIPPLLEPREADKCYDPTRYTADGQVTPPREIPCTEANLPGSNVPPPTPGETPVAPRDQGN